jgi:hypothetical protein
MNISLDISAFTYRPISLIVSKRAMCFSLWYLRFHLKQYHCQHGLEVDMSYESQVLLIFFDLSNGVLQSKDEI